jgi:6-phosphofructokinase 1
MRRIGVLTSGGDSPGMNAAIRAVQRAASSRRMDTIGYLDGFGGLVYDRTMELTDRSVGNIIQRGGTIIGTSRCPEFMEPEGRAKAAENMRRAGVEGLVVIGGDGSFKGALALQEEHGTAVAGIPGTIDNDVWGTEETLGFDTAVNTAMLAIDQVRDTSESTGMIFFVEVMGRRSGAIALETAVAAGAVGVLVPESQSDITRLAERIEGTMARGKRSHIIVVAEGDEAGGAFGVADRFSKLLPYPHRVVVLGHIQRGGSPTARDRIIAAQSGALAVQALADGRSGLMIGMQGMRPVELSLKDVVEHGHPPPNYGLLQLAQEIAG